MRTTEEKNIEVTMEPILVDTDGLRKILNVGRPTAIKIGTDAKAKVDVGMRRCLWNVEKVKEYINSISE